MSKNIFDKADIILLGAGCASLSLAARANELIDYEFTVIDPGIYPAQDHIWGFWRMPWLANTKPISRKSWYKWKIISHTTALSANENAQSATAALLPRENIFSVFFVKLIDGSIRLSLHIVRFDCFIL